MVIVDASVWIDYYRGETNDHTAWLDREMGLRRIGLTDRILCEVLQGIQADKQFAKTVKELSAFQVFDSGGRDLAIDSARNDRHLRHAGKTVRTPVDCLIATFCVVYDHELLHRDRDFDAFEHHLGLRVVHPKMP